MFVSIPFNPGGPSVTRPGGPAAPGNPTKPLKIKTLALYHLL